MPGVGRGGLEKLLASFSPSCGGLPLPGSCTSETDEGGDGQIESRSVSRYDAEGRQARQEYFANGRLARVFLREYDANGDYVRLEQQQPAPATGELRKVYEQKITYDERHRQVLQIEDKRGDGTRVFEHHFRYAEHAGPVEYWAGLQGSGRVGTRVIYEYDAAHRPTLERWYEDATDVPPFLVVRMQYDAAGRLVERSEENLVEGTSHVTTTRHVYDDLGRETLEEVLSEGAHDHSNAYAYEGGRLVSRRLLVGEGRALRGEVRMAYDARGHLAREEHDGTPDQPRGDEGAPAADGAPEAIVEYDHDADGNLLGLERKDARTGAVLERSRFGYGCWLDGTP